MNTISAAFIIVGVIFDIGVWYFVKDLKIFDDEIHQTELNEVNKDEEKMPEKQSMAL